MLGHCRVSARLTSAIAACVSEVGAATMLVVDDRMTVRCGRFIRPSVAVAVVVAVSIALLVNQI